MAALAVRPATPTARLARASSTTPKASASRVEHHVSIWRSVIARTVAATSSSACSDGFSGSGLAPVGPFDDGGGFHVNGDGAGLRLGLGDCLDRPQGVVVAYHVALGGGGSVPVGGAQRQRGRCRTPATVARACLVAHVRRLGGLVGTVMDSRRRRFASFACGGVGRSASRSSGAATSVRRIVIRPRYGRRAASRSAPSYLGMAAYASLISESLMNATNVVGLAVGHLGIVGLSQLGQEGESCSLVTRRTPVLRTPPLARRSPTSLDLVRISALGPRHFYLVGGGPVPESAGHHGEQDVGFAGSTMLPSSSMTGAERCTSGTHVFSRSMSACSTAARNPRCADPMSRVRPRSSR